MSSSERSSSIVPLTLNAWLTINDRETIRRYDIKTWILSYKKKKRETGSIKYNIRTKRQVRVGTGCDEGETVGEVNREPAEQGA